MSAESETYLYDAITNVAFPLSSTRLAALGGELVHIIVEGNVTDSDLAPLSRIGPSFRKSRNLRIMYNAQKNA
jgi:hypothetical protein